MIAENAKYTPYSELKLQLLQKFDPIIDRKKFCKFHGISESKLSRIMKGVNRCDDDLFDSLCRYVGVVPVVFTHYEFERYKVRNFIDDLLPTKNETIEDFIK